MSDPAMAAPPESWTRRILDFPVRAAAVDDFLRELRARGSGDLNAVLTTLNESGLCRTAVDYWSGSGWIVVAPNTPLVALAGPRFERGLELRRFCGEIEEPAGEPGASAAPGEESERDGDS
jgi:hypothetical protein